MSEGVLTALSVIATLCAITFGYIAFTRNKKKDDADEGKATGAIMKMCIRDRVIGCKINDAPIFARKPIFEQFTVQLSCLNPFWREASETREDIATWIGGFEFPVPKGLEITEGWEIGYRQPSLIVNVYNSGDVKSGIRIEFRAIGALSDPQLLNVNTQEFIKLNIDLIAVSYTHLDVYKRQDEYRCRGVVFRG